MNLVSGGSFCRLNTDTNITGLLFDLDPEPGKINTPHGEVSFIQILGITNEEVEHLKANPGIEANRAFIEALMKGNPFQQLSISITL